MKVVILSEGGGSIGLGHISRCRALREAFREKGVSSALIVNDKGKSKSKSELSRKRDHLVFDWLKKARELPGLIADAEICVIDSYLAKQAFYTNLSRLVKTPVYIDDNSRLAYPKGVVLNGAVHAGTLRYPKKSGIQYILGPQYALLRRQYWQIGRRNLRATLKNVLVTLGGNDELNLTGKIVQLLNKHYEGLSITAIVAAGHKMNNRAMLKPEKKRNRVRILGPIPTLKDLMLEADICIAGGGQTIYELAATGTPAICLCKADNQKNNLKSWSSHGFIENLGWVNAQTLEKKLLTSFGTLMNYKTRRARSLIGQRVVDGLGAKRAVSKILEYYENN